MNKKLVDFSKILTQDQDLKWKVETRALFQLLIEDNPRGTALMKPLQILQGLLIELAGEIIRVNDPALVKIALRLALIEVDEETIPKPTEEEIKAEKREIRCIQCGRWIGTDLIDKDGSIWRTNRSSDFIGRNKPCRDCEAEKER